ncbi:hypothetical protein [Streptomyces sp. NPDC059176]|uniref:hypothetical protein n=1 Tax=unclassified Streptomyces TaxID=2593676 RepID=UPI00367738A8
MSTISWKMRMGLAASIVLLGGGVTAPAAMAAHVPQTGASPTRVPHELPADRDGGLLGKVKVGMDGSFRVGDRVCAGNCNGSVNGTDGSKGGVCVGLCKGSANGGDGAVGVPGRDGTDGGAGGICTGICDESANGGRGGDGGVATEGSDGGTGGRGGAGGICIGIGCLTSGQGGDGGDGGDG